MKKRRAGPDGKFSLLVWAKSVGWRLLLFLLLWWALVEGRVEDYGFIAASVGLGLIVSYFSIPIGSWRLRPLGVVASIPFFLWHSLRGGLDVARRAFTPSMPLEPGFIEYPLNSTEKQSLILCWLVSLLPGTASVRLQSSVLRLHVLDKSLQTERQIKEVEKWIARCCD